MALAFEDIVYDQKQRQLRKNGTLLKVEPLWLELLDCFLAHPGALLTKQDLYARIWQRQAISENVLTVAVSKLRRVLGQTEQRVYIENRYGQGYRFVPSVVRVDNALLPDLAAKAPESCSPLVGRAETVSRLESALDRAISGQGSLCVLLGEPGIGKTRLAEAVHRAAKDRDARPVWVRWQPEEKASPLWAFARALRDLHGVLLAKRIRANAAATQEDDAPLMSAGAALIDSAALAATKSDQLVEDLIQTFQRSSEQQPLVILLDDLHWADATSLRMLNHLVDDVRRWPILVVATARSTELILNDQRGRALSRLLLHRHCERFELERLPETAVAEYVTALFGRCNDDVGREVFARSEGNPFFMVELLRPWVGRGEELNPQRLQVPGIALELLRQRVRALPEVSQAALAAAAVIGHDFDLGLLGFVTELSADELLEALDSSLANDTIVLSADHPGSYAFDHELIREVVYKDLSVLERCRLHHRVGQGLVHRCAAGADVAITELANHSLSALPLGDLALAIDHARKAASAAHRMASLTDAHALLRRALTSLSFCVEPEPRTRTALLLELSMVERALGDKAYVEHLAQGVAIAREHRFGDLLALGGQCLSVAPGAVPHPDAHATLEAAERALPDSDQRWRAIVLAHKAWTPPTSFSEKKVRALLAEAELLAEASQREDARAAVRSAKLFFLAGPDTVGSAEAVAAKIDGESKDREPVATRANRFVTSKFRYIVATQRGDRLAAKAALDEVAASVTRLKNVEMKWHYERMLFIERMNRGELDGVFQELDRLRERAKRLEMQGWRDSIAMHYGTLLLRRGEAASLAQRIRPALSVTAGDTPASMARKLRCMAEFELGEDARDALQHVTTELLHALPRDRDYISALCNLTLACTLTPDAPNRTELCTALYELLSPYPDMFAVDISLQCDGAVSYYLARLAVVCGRHEAAIAHYDRALQRNSALELWPCTAQSGLELATLLLDCPAARDIPRARELLERTGAIAKQFELRAVSASVAIKMNAIGSFLKSLHQPDSCLPRE